MPRILVLDDEKLIRWSLGQILSQEGYAVDVVATAEEALRLTGSNLYDILLADLEVCGDRAETIFRELLAGQPEAQLVILTAIPRDKAGERLGGCRPFEILEKPFASDTIKAAMIDALKNHRTIIKRSKEV